jgi:hypothetical protein
LKLPDNILAELNLSLSRHQHPEDLDWQLERGKWTATAGSRKFVILHDEKLGYVIAEMKNVSYDIGAKLHRG